LATALLCLCTASPGHADLPLYRSGDDGLSASGDFRLRLESDWDSRRSDGSQREDRLRLRVRARLGLEYRHGERFSAGLRLRSGSDLAQQSGHITVYDFDGNSTGDADFNFDRWYLRYQHGGFSAWAGRNNLPYWKQDELFWDDDVTPVGLAASHQAGLGGGRLTLNAGLMSLPAGLKAFSGQLLLGQAVWDGQLSGLGLTLAAGLFDIRGDADNADGQAILLDGNHARDYRIVALQGQLRGELAGRPLLLGVDLGRNLENYADPGLDAYTLFHRDQDSAWAAFLHWGEAASAGQWLLGYAYAHIETLAVNNSYVQDDWLRWGNGPQVRSSNFQGHELRAVYALGTRVNVMARMYRVEAIKEQAADSLAMEDGKRWRVDLNFTF